MLEELRKRRKQALDANRMKIQRNGGGLFSRQGHNDKIGKNKERQGWHDKWLKVLRSNRKKIRNSLVMEGGLKVA